MRGQFVLLQLVDRFSGAFCVIDILPSQSIVCVFISLYMQKDKLVKGNPKYITSLNSLFLVL